MHPLLAQQPLGDCSTNQTVKAEIALVDLAVEHDAGWPRNRQDRASLDLVVMIWYFCLHDLLAAFISSFFISMACMPASLTTASTAPPYSK